MSLVATLNSGISALNSFSTGLQVIANDIANVNTTGYKSSRADYEDSFSNILRQAAPAPSSGNGSNIPPVQIGTGVRVATISSDFSQGTLSATGKSTDLGISGSGFFRVRDAVNAQDYVTRSGNFRIDDSAHLVTAAGFRVQGLFDGAISYSAINDNGTLRYVKTQTPPAAVGDIKIDMNIGLGNGLTNDTGGAFTDAQVEAGKPFMRSFTVDQLGNVVIGLSNGDSFTRGRVLLQNFSDPNALTHAGGSLFTGFEPAGPIGGLGLTAANNGPGSNTLGRIEVGALELSNVDLSREMTDMIIVQRSFQAGSRVVTVSDQMLEEIVNLKR
jgi:flagellar hook protein FlgE